MDAAKNITGWHIHY